MKLPKNTPSSLLFHEGCLGKALDISMAMNPIDRSTWSVSGGKELLLEFFKQYLLTKGKYLMTWKQYRRLALLPIQGRVARWYREVAHLCTSRIDNITVTDDLELAEVNYWVFLLDIISDACRKQVIFVQEPLANSDVCEWLSSTHQPNITILEDRLPISAQNPIISLPLVQDIWIHRWIDDDILKAQLMDIRNNLTERTSVEYYTDGSLRPITPTSMGKQDPNLVYTNISAAFCVNNEPALSVQANVSLSSSSTHLELVAIFLALLTSPMNAKIKIYIDSQSAIYMINNQHNKSGRKLLKQSNSLILLKIDILLQEKKMDLVLVKVKGHSGNVMNEMVDELAKNTSNSSCYFNNRFNYSNRTVRFFPIFKQISIEYNLRKFIKTLMNTRVAAEWSMLKTNGHEIPIA
ncbi:unnamed protein product [Rhizophagus irregularis]|nr:unnamed protein product [Rhizophagus irregularis]